MEDMMAALYLEEMQQAFLEGARDLQEVAVKLNITFESACLIFNNGLLKGYWQVEVKD